MIVVDTSALAKLLVAEEYSSDLRVALSSASSAGQECVVSTIATVELRRVAIRLEADPRRAEPILSAFRTVRLTEAVLQLAGRFPYRHLATLDALHLATALVVEAQTIMTYDDRLADAARSEGFEVLSPGR
ncbi:type II toxin-antitoxin system VapC family toxin [Microbacterium luticocti]|uniref:type II toxin-antitoxin system VapC family toxin n=1 Tax=Microbacterium luticocti TaxID=451764 RepID=UPI000418872E|nr:type II toxin-antitoxin system VapC family toxin [Microbacterium luticocti]